LQLVIQVNDNISKGDVNADVTCNLVVDFALISDSGLGERVFLQVPSKAEAPGARSTNRKPWPKPDQSNHHAAGDAGQAISAKFATAPSTRCGTIDNL
jgi:hypothetical protein